MFYLLNRFIQMKILLNNNDLNEALNNVKNLGFVPTMGSLHKGHISLIKESLRKTNKTIVSIFINHTQFNNKNDFIKYPRNKKKDLSILKRLNVDFVYLPNAKDIYDYKRTKKIKLKNKDKILCAKYRTGHFEGVLDVMDRLVNKISPKYVFMGLKDFQQLFLVKNYIEKKYKSRIVPCKTVRNSNNLALSSRNLLLEKSALSKAEKLIQNLINFKKNLSKVKDLKKVIYDQKIKLSQLFNVNIEYLELIDEKNFKVANKTKNSKLFIAFYLGKIRLIDNI